jgi:hypothetical protein
LRLGKPTGWKERAALRNRQSDGATYEELRAAIDGARTSEWLAKRAGSPFAVVFANIASLRRFAHEGRKGPWVPDTALRIDQGIASVAPAALPAPPPMDARLDKPMATTSETTVGVEASATSVAGKPRTPMPEPPRRGSEGLGADPLSSSPLASPCCEPKGKAPTAGRDAIRAEPSPKQKPAPTPDEMDSVLGRRPWIPDTPLRIELSIASVAPAALPAPPPMGVRHDEPMAKPETAEGIEASTTPVATKLCTPMAEPARRKPEGQVIELFASSPTASPRHKPKAKATTTGCDRAKPAEQKPAPMPDEMRSVLGRLHVGWKVPRTPGCPPGCGCGECADRRRYLGQGEFEQRRQQQIQLAREWAAAQEPAGVTASRSSFPLAYGRPAGEPGPDVGTSGEIEIS